MLKIISIKSFSKLKFISAKNHPCDYFMDLLVTIGVLLLERKHRKGGVTVGVLDRIVRAAESMDDRRRIEMLYVMEAAAAAWPRRPALRLVRGLGGGLDDAIAHGPDHAPPCVVGGPVGM